MTIIGRILDAIKKSAVQGATVSIVNIDGSDPGINTISDDIGRFAISNPGIALESTIKVTHPNYFDKSIKVTGLTDYGFISLIEKPKPTETTTAQSSDKSWLLWLAIAAAVLLALNKKRKTRNKKQTGRG